MNVEVGARLQFCNRNGGKVELYIQNLIRNKTNPFPAETRRGTAHTIYRC